MQKKQKIKPACR